MRPFRNLAVLTFASSVVGTAAVVGGQSAPLPRSAPELQGVSSGDLRTFIQAADAEIDEMHSFMLVRHGHVVAEGWWAPYNPNSNHMLYSLSKSFTSTAVGMAVTEGKLSIDDPVLSFFPEEGPADPSSHLKAMRVRDLLTMATGHQDETPFAADRISAKTFLAHPVPHLPGTHFKYNTPATFMLSAIVQKQTGQTLTDFLEPRLFQPLGIDKPLWDRNWQGIGLGGSGLRVRTEDIAKLGQLYLQGGLWEGRQLLPADWVKLATSRQVSNGSNPTSDWNQGYGFQFWRCRHNAYRGDGAFGQYCMVLPEQDTVVAITSGVRNMQAVLNLIWEKLLPALRPVGLPPEPAARADLDRTLSALRVSPAEGSGTSPQLAAILDRRFLFEPNDLELKSLTLTRAEGANEVVLSIEKEQGTSRFPCRYDDWAIGRGNIGSLSDEPIAGSWAWPEERRCVIKICAYETPYAFTLSLGFEGDRLNLTARSNVGFGPTEWPELIARAE